MIADAFVVVPCDVDCVGVETSVAVQTDNHFCSFANKEREPDFGTAIFELSDEEVRVCREKVVEYGNALQSVASTVGFTFIDFCSE